MRPHAHLPLLNSTYYTSTIHPPNMAPPYLPRHGFTRLRATHPRLSQQKKRRTARTPVNKKKILSPQRPHRLNHLSNRQRSPLPAPAKQGFNYDCPFVALCTTLPMARPLQVWRAPPVARSLSRLRDSLIFFAKTLCYLNPSIHQAHLVRLPRQGFTYFCLALCFAPFTCLKFCNTISTNQPTNMANVIFAPPRGASPSSTTPPQTPSTLSSTHLFSRRFATHTKTYKKTQKTLVFV